MFFAEEPDAGFNEDGFEDGSGFALNLFEDCVDFERGAVGAAGGKRVDDIGQSQDSGSGKNGFAFQAAGIA